MRAASFSLLLLGGCALFPLSEVDCRSDNWFGRGYADGYAGHPPQDLRLVPECRERYGLRIDQELYLKGWRDGHDEWDRIQGSVDMD